jgi:hypothetical protein
MSVSTVARPGAVRIEPAYDDPAAVLQVIRAVPEYWPLARYAPSPEEMVAVGGDVATASYVPPWFRRDFALAGDPLVPGAELILHNDRFVHSTHAVFGAAAIVRPTTVYVNVMVPSVAPFQPHLDVPAFRGITRANYPLWLLHQMMFSGLFEPWRVKLATAVSWFYEGRGGEFHYWPDGPERDGAVERPPFRNVAVLADNERTYHGVAPVGGSTARLVQGLSRESLLHRVPGGWEMRNGDTSCGSATDDDVRITVSWKAEVFADADECARADDHTDDLTLDAVVDTFLADLHRRGIDAVAPGDPLGDRSWVALISSTYGRPGPRVPD